MKPSLLISLLIAILAGCQTARQPNPQVLALDLQAPSAGYTMEIAEVQAVGNVLHVLARVTPPPQGMVQSQRLTRLSASTQVMANADQVIYYVAGPRLPVPPGSPPVTFIDENVDTYRAAVRAGNQLQLLPVPQRSRL